MIKEVKKSRYVGYLARIVSIDDTYEDEVPTVIEIEPWEAPDLIAVLSTLYADHLRQEREKR